MINNGDSGCRVRLHVAVHLERVGAAFAVGIDHGVAGRHVAPLFDYGARWQVFVELGAIALILWCTSRG